MNQIHGLIDQKKKAEVLQRIRDRKAPFCATKSEPDRRPDAKANPITKGQRKLNNELIEAAKAGNYEIVKTLIEKGADVNAKDELEITALMWASAWGRTEVAKLLIKNNADVNAKDSNGWTALMKASVNNNFETSELLLEKGADVNARDNYGKTALDRAREFGQLIVAGLLVENGATE